MESNKPTITVQTIIKAHVDKVWGFWTKPEHITNWNFATDKWCCPNATNDLKPGGAFNWRMEAKDGTMGFDFTGTYNIVIERELITYEMPDGRVVKIDFLDNESETIVRETFDAEGTHSDEQQRTGWQAILENFKNYVESKQ